MSTLWWLIVLWLVGSVCFLGGYVLRAEMELWNRTTEIDLTSASKAVR